MLTEAIIAVLYCLIEAGADVEARNEYRWKSLMHAAGCNSSPQVIATFIRPVISNRPSRRGDFR